jgi:hypothetical protein
VGGWVYCLPAVVFASEGYPRTFLCEDIKSLAHLLVSPAYHSRLMAVTCEAKRASFSSNFPRNTVCLRAVYLDVMANPPHPGNIVRIGPNEVYYASSAAYRAIYAQVPSLIKGPYYNQFNSIEGVGNLFTERNRDQHHLYKSTFSNLFSRRNIAKMEDMIKSKCDMLKGHMVSKIEGGQTVDILAAVRSLATDVISIQSLGRCVNE